MHADVGEHIRQAGAWCAALFGEGLQRLAREQVVRRFLQCVVFPGAGPPLGVIHSAGALGATYAYADIRAERRIA